VATYIFFLSACHIIPSTAHCVVVTIRCGSGSPCCQRAKKENLCSVAAAIDWNFARFGKKLFPRRAGDLCGVSRCFLIQIQNSTCVTLSLSLRMMMMMMTKVPPVVPGTFIKVIGVRTKLAKTRLGKEERTGVVFSSLVNRRIQIPKYKKTKKIF
jgi:hypothetical protein